MDTIEKDVYVAYQGNNQVYIAVDEYVISRMPTGFLVESDNTVFGVNGFQQKSTLRTNHQWQMQELKVIVESMGIEMNASAKNGKLYLQQKQNDANYEKVINLQHDNYFFMYNGTLVILMIWLRGFDFDNFEKITYQMLPTGYAEVKQIQDSVSGRNERSFSILMFLQNFTDIVKVQTDMSGKMLFFHSETNQLTIKLQTK